MHDVACHSRGVRIAGYDVVRIVLGLILLTAAALKGHQLATEPVAETSLFTSRWFLIGVVEFELFFGLWLLSGLYPRRTWQAALVCFSAFACVSLYKALSGEASCGCFGRVPVNPWYTLVLDLAAVAALTSRRPARRAATSPLPLAGEGPGVRAGASLLPLAAEGPGVRGGVFPLPLPGPGVRVRLGTRLGWILGIFLPAGISAALATGSYQAAMMDDSGDIFGESQFVVLEPETWVGKRFPLLNYIDIGGQLAHGEWVVVMYRADCPKCEDTIPKYEAVFCDLKGGFNSPRLALVEMPSQGAPRAQFGCLDSCSCGRLRDTRKWLVTAPLQFILVEGIVTRILDARELLPEEDWRE